MEIIKVIPQGFCKGVIRAIQIAKKTVLEYPNQPIYILGMIVHNQYVVDALTELGIQTIDDKNKTRLELLDQIPSGVVILTAHGSSLEVKEKAKKKGLIVIDATCLDVQKTQDAIQEKLQEGYEILYLGKQKHPEAEAMISTDPKHIHLIYDENCAQNVQPQTQKLYLTNQTTMSMMEVSNWIQILKNRFPSLEIQEEICQATRQRQQAILNLKNQGVDSMIIVGDPHSNNTRKLEDVAYSIGIKNVYRIEQASELDISKFTSMNKVAITSGASTPSYLTNQVISYLESQGKINPIVDLNKLLPF
ncbi:MAG: 4-hydroxy-3-methylbut-2-enyl diphosphate reductase [Erysipelotrichaceae bacterium]|nr:4-hydroxy-3-methylbut-2-enyl diphosphate reductase [Erysipelotrichaceae bacterium]